jgi:succinate dehydrogenase hydrophobic anchor subunit
MNEAKLRFWFYVAGILTAILLGIHLSMLFITPLNFVERTSTGPVDYYLRDYLYDTALSLLLIFAFTHGILGIRRTLYNYGIKNTKIVEVIMLFILFVLLYFLFTSFA